ncbi:MAG: hypothetical protein M5U12_35560 [Verrucomicrobia bacterium]|nr:hypothetical protein [Verrucomicrobiota bacterium]
MLAHLDRKLVRDLSRMKGQAVAVALVMACGLAMMIMARSLIHSLESTRQEYYQAKRFADVFVHLKRAPLFVAEQVAALPRRDRGAAQHRIADHAGPPRPGRTRQRAGVVAPRLRGTAPQRPASPCGTLADAGAAERGARG